MIEAKSPRPQNKAADTAASPDGKNMALTLDFTAVSDLSLLSASIDHPQVAARDFSSPIVFKTVIR
jgi:hypothetical protein